MSVWTRLQDLMARAADNAADMLGAISEWFHSVTSAEARRQVAFTIAMISLSAKMAKADGVVTKDEIVAFQDLFEIPEGQEKQVARFFNLAKQDIAGYEDYARQLATLLKDEPETLSDIVDGLFHIAAADGVIHEDEDIYLENVALIFGLTRHEFHRIRARHTSDPTDPYFVLGAERDWDFDALRKHYRKMVAENHPDRLIARGVPKEFIRIANDKLAAINAAWDLIEKERAA